jgi:Family of unknown function (DUF5832)
MESFNLTNAAESPLTADESAAAVATLYTPRPFRIANRNFVDPIKHTDPTYFLFTFVPSKNAVADESGWYGVAKIRGFGHTLEEVDLRAKEIIEKIDSSNSIFTGVCGRPFPLVTRGFASDLVEVDVSNKTEQIISDNVRAKQKAAEKEMKEMEQRRAALVKEDGTINDDISGQELYIQERVKLAHLKYACFEHLSKRDECLKSIERVKAFLRNANTENPEYEENFIKRYKEGRRAAKIPEETDFVGFMKFIAEDIDVDVDRVFCDTCKKI